MAVSAVLHFTITVSWFMFVSLRLIWLFCCCCWKFHSNSKSYHRHWIIFLKDAMMVNMFKFRLMLMVGWQVMRGGENAIKAGLTQLKDSFGITLGQLAVLGLCPSSIPCWWLFDRFGGQSAIIAGLSHRNQIASGNSSHSCQHWHDTCNICWSMWTEYVK